MLRSGIPRLAVRFSVAAVLLLLCTGLLAQTTVGTGSIVGTVSDPSGAVLSGAKVTITNVATGQTIDLTVNSAGSFTSGALTPGTYKVVVAAKGFSTVNTTTNVQLGNIATVNTRMTLGQESTTIEVQASAVQVNTEQATVQGVLTSAQIENLPVNGRNFLDLAQLEPGVQIQDGQNFDPTKAGYSSISFGGRFGRTARINVDGVDVSDETVGTTTADIPASAIDEFQLSQSSLDLSQDLTSSGAVNVTTKSGTNSYHGEGFYFIRDHRLSANAPGGVDQPFQRQQFGGKFGGPVIKNKLFFFADAERTKQDAFATVLFAQPFSQYSGGFSQPFRENNLLGRVDYDLGNGARAFYRFSYFENLLASDFGLGYAVYNNEDKTRNHVAGIDFNTGSFTHTIRFSYLKFQNQIVDSVVGSNLPFANLGVTIFSGTLYGGPSPLAPQSTPQSNHQIKYDGTKVIHSHTLRYGVAFNHIQGGGFASFYGTAPRISWTTSACNPDSPQHDPNCGFALPDPGTSAFFANNSCGTGTPCFPGGDTNPLNYPVQRFRVGNGQGFATLQSALGFPAGGLGPDNRLGLYVGDSWKVRPNFTVSLGLRYDRDTGRTDSDLPAIPEVNAVFPGAGNRVKQSNLNFAPQVGVAWDPKNNGKTVIRAGAGLFYENVIFNNVLFDRPLRLRTGAFNQVTYACFNGTPQGVPVLGGQVTPDAALCGNVALGSEIPQLLDFWQSKVLAGNPFSLTAPNPSFVGSLLGAGLGSNAGINLFDPNYKTPVSFQMNVGFQHEIRHGMVFSADYLRNVETRTLLGTDINRMGSVSNFNATAAQAAINATINDPNTGCGGGTLATIILPGGCPNLHPVTPSDPTPSGATIADFASNGLGTDADVNGVGCGNPTSAGGLNRPCAFGGKNTSQSAFFLLKPMGRSVYNALQMKLTQNVANPIKGVKAVNFQVSYSLSRLSSVGGGAVNGVTADNDQDFVIGTPDYDKPGRYFGPNLLDRTHQVSFGGYADVPGGFRVGLISHFYSPLSSPIDAPVAGAGGEIFRSDFTGDGTFGDPLPGTHMGQFDRGTDAKGLATLINKYNSVQGGQPTPAGQALVSAGLFTVSQLQTIGAVAPTIPAPPTGQQNFGWLRATDLKLAWRHTFRERYTVEPSVGIYNLFNFANFNLPPITMNSILNGPGSGSLNGTTRADLEAFRVGNGTGVYSLGSARQIEFGMRLVF